MNKLFLFIALVFSSETFCDEYQIDHQPLAGIYLGGEHSRSLVLGYAAVFVPNDSNAHFDNGLYVDAEVSKIGNAVSFGYLRTSDVGLVRVGISSLATDTDGLGEQKYIGLTATMSVMFLSFRLAYYQGENGSPLVRDRFTSASIGLGF